MCGIHGFNFADPDLVDRMIAAARHRGPDGEGRFADSALTLGHNLLAITDITARSEQPWRVDDDAFVLCYNGEAYNVAELRAALKQCGDVFRTDCDTEVVAAGLRRFGAGFLHRIDGMYALAWYDRPNRRLLLARDAAGTKPLYYYRQGRRFAFSSEIRPLLAHGLARRIDRFALGLYLHLGYVPGPLTLFDGVRKLVPGEYLMLDVASGETIERGSTVPDQPASGQPFEAGAFRAAVGAAARQCLLGRRKTSLYLSGGLDSAMLLHEIVAAGHAVETFSTRFETTADDLPYNEDADAAARLSATYGLTHRELVVTEADFAAAVEPSIAALEEPRYNPSTPAYWLAARGMAATGAVVTLGGDGGDELLAGYPKYADMRRMLRGGVFDPPTVRNDRSQRYDTIPREVWRHVIPPDYDLSRQIDRWYYVTKFYLDERGRSAGHRFDFGRADAVGYMAEWLPLRWSGDVIEDQMRLERLAWLPEDCLIRADKLGMSFGMEGRFPLLTRPVVDYCAALPSAIKMSNVGGLKAPARAAYRGLLPDFILDRGKTGWAAPARPWLATGPFACMVEAALTPDYHPPLAELLDFEGVCAHRVPQAVLTLFALQVWARTFGVGV